MYITVLDFDEGIVYQYEIENESYVRHKKIEEFLVDEGHNLEQIEWMRHLEADTILQVREI